MPVQRVYFHTHPYNVQLSLTLFSRIGNMLAEVE